MRFSRSLRSAIALCTAAVLLLCQTAFAAQACGHGFNSPPATHSGTPCHDSMDESTSAPADPAAASDCDAPKAVAQAVKVPVLSVTDFPPLQVVQRESPRIVPASSAAHAIPAACHPPPLTLLHCRFLI